jgi:hypothetical protein
LITFRSKIRQHAGQNLQAKVFFVAQSISATLDDAYLVVQSLDEAERDFVFWYAVSGDPIPVPLDHCREGFVGFESLPLQLRAPIVEELACPGFATVIPELAEGFLEQVCGVESLVSRGQQFQILTSGTGEVLRMRQEGVFLAFDEAPLLALEPRVLNRCRFDLAIQT